jgi:subtilisin family serine protease
MPRHWRSRVAVLLALLLVATLLPTSAFAADPPPTPDSPPSQAPTIEPVAESSPDPAVDPAPDPTPDVPPAPPAGAGDRYLVLLKDGADVGKALKRLEGRAGFKAERAFRHALKGFSARLGKGQLKKIRDDSAVVAVVPDERIELAAQSIPTGVSRVNGRLSDIAAIDGVDQRVDADVAIVDTGIALHPDLNVVGGIDCSTSDPTAWRDRQSHGTHVAGIVGALDNDIGVVGIAPGVRLWAVKILNDSGFGYIRGTSAASTGSLPSATRMTHRDRSSRPST